jgi:hypothetical protein
MAVGPEVVDVLFVIAISNIQKEAETAEDCNCDACEWCGLEEAAPNQIN